MNQPNQQTNQLHPKLLAIGELFNDEARYTVPIYQRNYAWQAEQIEQMIGDIQDAMRDQKESYFLGNFIVTRRQSRDGAAVATADYEVIDGQQRLTTLYLLLSFLRNTSHLGWLQYESRPRATAALERIARETFHSATTSAPEQHSEDAGITQGYNTIKQYLKQHIKSVAAKTEFREFLLRKVTVVRVTLPAKTDFNRYFEIMNTRGQQLQQVDIVKARLMKYLDNEAERACFAWIWNACAEMDSYVQMTLTPKDTEMRTKVFGDNWSFVVVGSFDDLLAMHKPTAFTHSIAGGSGALGLAEAINEYSRMGVVENQENEENARFQSIITFPAFVLHVLKIVRKDHATEDEGQLDDKALVKRFTEFLNDADPDKQREKAKRFAFALLRCRNLVDSYIIKRQYTGANRDEGDWSLQLLFKRGKAIGYKNTYSREYQETEDGCIDEATRELLMLESMLRVTYTSPRTMHWITRMLRVLVEKQQGESILDEFILISELRDYAREKVKAAFFDVEEQPQGFGIERIVFTYLDYLIWKEKLRPESKSKANFTFTFRNSIEHFYPQNPNEEQRGKARVSQKNLHLLGNLALASVGANSKFSNNLPSVKAKEYKETIIQQSCKLTRMANITRKNEYNWGDQEVLNHHTKMVNLLKDDLGINNL